MASEVIMTTPPPQPAELELPGFRFHPTEEELLEFYLKSVVFGKRMCFDIIDFLNIYRHDPWDLPGLSKIGEREWYFFVPRDRKHGSGGRPNRTTETGFWKATGSDRKIVSLSDPKRIIGLRKTLVFYKGRAPRGTKTDWVMNEYRLPDCKLLKDIVLCKIYRKATSLKVLEQRAAMEEEMKMGSYHDNSPNNISSSPPTSMDTTISFSSFQEHDEPQHHHDLTAQIPIMPANLKREAADDAALAVVVEQQLKEEDEQAMEMKESTTTTPTSVIQTTPFGKDNKLPELLVPKMSMDWTQDQFWAPMNSPWLLSTPYAHILNLELL